MDPATILIVDDSPVGLSMIRGVLVKDGHTLTEADCGQAALDIVRDNPTFDLILLHVVLPDISGIELCRQLKADSKTTHVPIVFISAVRTDDESVREGLEAGAIGYLRKPLQDNALRAWVNAALRIGRLEHALSEQREAHEVVGFRDVLEAFSNLSHAVNNPLQALFAAADILSLSLPDNLEQRNHVTEILVHAERVAETVSNASYLARVQLEKVDGNDS